MKEIKSFFRGFQNGLRNFSVIIISVVNFILLLIVYIFGVGLASIFAKLFNKHFLDMKTDKRKSYYTERRIGKEEISSYYNQF